MSDVFRVIGVPLERLTQYVRRRCRNPSDVEDVVQETLMRTFEQEQKQQLDNPMAYAFRVADSVIYKSARNTLQLEAVPEHDLACALPGVEETLDYQQRFLQFREALDQMPKLRSEVFVRRHLHGQSRGEIAVALGLSVEAVKKHLVRARMDLSDLRIDLTEAGPTRSPREEPSP